MPPKPSLPTSRHHIMLFDEDWDWLEAEYGPGGHKSEVGISRAIRTIIHARVQGMKAKINGEIDKLRDVQRKEEKGPDANDE